MRSIGRSCTFLIKPDFNFFCATMPVIIRADTSVCPYMAYILDDCMEMIGHDNIFIRCWLNFTIRIFKMSVATGAFGKSAGPFSCFFGNRGQTVGEFVGHCFFKRQIKLLDG